MAHRLVRDIVERGAKQLERRLHVACQAVFVEPELEPGLVQCPDDIGGRAMSLGEHPEILAFRVEGWKIDQRLIDVPAPIVAAVDRHAETVPGQAPLAHRILRRRQVVQKFHIGRIDIEGQVEVFIAQIAFSKAVALERHLGAQIRHVRIADPLEIQGQCIAAQLERPGACAFQGIGERQVHRARDRTEPRGGAGNEEFVIGRRIGHLEIEIGHLHSIFSEGQFTLSKHGLHADFLDPRSAGRIELDRNVGRDAGEEFTIGPKPRSQVRQRPLGDGQGCLHAAAEFAGMNVDCQTGGQACADPAT